MSVQKIGSENLIKSSTPYSLSIQEGDTFIIKFDMNEFDCQEAQALLEVYEKAFPHNNFMLTPKGIDIEGVIHNESNKAFYKNL